MADLRVKHQRLPEERKPTPRPSPPRRAQRTCMSWELVLFVSVVGIWVVCTRRTIPTYHLPSTQDPTPPIVVPEMQTTPGNSYTAIRSSGPGLVAFNVPSALSPALVPDSHIPSQTMAATPSLTVPSPLSPVLVPETHTPIPEIAVTTSSTPGHDDSSPLLPRDDLIDVDVENLPISLRNAQNVIHPEVRAELQHFFKPGAGGTGSFKIFVDTTCIEGPHALPGANPPVGAWRRPSKRMFQDGKFGQAVWLPALIGSSSWITSDPQRANLSLALIHLGRFAPHNHFSLCRRALAAHSPSWQPTQGARHWFIATSDRGPCCDGGHFRDPSLLGHHFLVNNGERDNSNSNTSFMFREPWNVLRGHSWRAHVTAHTSPQIRCFHAWKDVVMAPPAWVDTTRDESMRSQALDLAARNRSRHILAMHAEGKQSPPEFQIRRALTKFGTATNDPALYFTVGITSQEHDQATLDSKYCLVTEGYAPWTPRLTESIARGCVPVLLSPQYRPPFSDVLDWSKFAVIDLEIPRDLERLKESLLARNYTELHSNLLAVRPLFRYCLNDGCDVDEGTLPLLIFEMAQRTGRLDGTPRAQEDLPGGLYGGKTAAVAGIESWACTGDGTSCSYIESVTRLQWNCSLLGVRTCCCFHTRPTEAHSSSAQSLLEDKPLRPELISERCPVSPEPSEKRYIQLVGKYGLLNNRMRCLANALGFARRTNAKLVLDTAWGNFASAALDTEWLQAMQPGTEVLPNLAFKPAPNAAGFELSCMDAFWCGGPCDLDNTAAGVLERKWSLSDWRSLRAGGQQPDTGHSCSQAMLQLRDHP